MIVSVSRAPTVESYVIQQTPDRLSNAKGLFSPPLKGDLGSLVIGQSALAANDDPQDS